MQGHDRTGQQLAKSEKTTDINTLIDILFFIISDEKCDKNNEIVYFKRGRGDTLEHSRFEIYATDYSFHDMDQIRKHCGGDLYIIEAYHSRGKINTEEHRGIQIIRSKDLYKFKYTKSSGTDFSNKKTASVANRLMEACKNYANEKGIDLSQILNQVK